MDALVHFLGRSPAFNQSSSLASGIAKQRFTIQPFREVNIALLQPRQHFREAHQSLRRSQFQQPQSPDHRDSQRFSGRPCRKIIQQNRSIQLDARSENLEIRVRKPPESGNFSDLHIHHLHPRWQVSNPILNHRRSSLALEFLKHSTRKNHILKKPRQVADPIHLDQVVERPGISNDPFQGRN